LSLFWRNPYTHLLFGFIELFKWVHIVVWINTFLWHQIKCFPWKTSDVYFNDSLGRLPTSLAKLELMNRKLSINTKLWPNKNAIYFSILFGIINLDFLLLTRFLIGICVILGYLANLLRFKMGLRLWNMTVILSVNWKLRLQA